MSSSKLVATLVVAAVLLPVATADGLIPPPFQPLLNGHFETNLAVTAIPQAEPFVDRCFGIGHQVLIPLYSTWGDWVFAAMGDPAALDPTARPPSSTTRRVIRSATRTPARPTPAR